MSCTVMLWACAILQNGPAASQFLVGHISGPRSRLYYGCYSLWSRAVAQVLAPFVDPALLFHVFRSRSLPMSSRDHLRASRVGSTGWAPGVLLCTLYGPGTSQTLLLSCCRVYKLVLILNSRLSSGDIQRYLLSPFQFPQYRKSSSCLFFQQ